MAISPSLRQFRSSGVYRLEFDKSQIISIPSETIRLIIGFSKKGPFNTPVFIQDSTTFTSIFGEVDTTLERKGSFFHRTVLTCLERGPVIVMNLLKLEDNDVSQFQRVSTSASYVNSSAQNAPVTSFFNIDKFWFPDSNSLIDYANTEIAGNVAKLLNIANVGRKTISVFTKKSDILGFDVLAKDWFGVGKVPEFINENDYISDYMIDVIVVEGDFSNYETLSIDPIFGSYFDKTGLKKEFIDQFGIKRDGLTAFLSLSQVNVLSVYTGSLIPEFQDKNGENLYIEDVINLETSRTGLLLGFDNDFLDDNPTKISADQIDLIGHTIESEEPGELDFLSYYGSIIDTLEYVSATGVLNMVIAATGGQTGANARVTASVGLTSLGASASNQFDTLTIYGPSSAPPSLYVPYTTNANQWSSFVNSIEAEKTFIEAGYTGTSTDVNYAKVVSKIYNSNADTLTLRISLSVDAGITGPTGSTGNYLTIKTTGVNTAGGTATLHIIPRMNQIFGDGTVVYSLMDSKLYQDNLSGIITDGDRISLDGDPTNLGYVDFTTYAENDFDSTAIGVTSTNASVFLPGPAPVLSKKVNYLILEAFDDVEFTTSVLIDAQSTYTIKTLSGSINETLIIDQSVVLDDPTNIIWLDNTANGPLGLSGFDGRIKKGDYLVGAFGENYDEFIDPLTGKSRLTRVISVTAITDPTSEFFGKIRVTTNEPIFIRLSGPDLQVEKYSSVENFITHYRPHVLRGYSLRPEQLPDGTLNRQNEILDVLYTSNLATALSDREVITFRYIVDTFEGSVEAASKIRLTRLAKSQQSSLAICNMPSVKQFRESVNPLFKREFNTAFDSIYIASGGNLDKNPSNVFSLPGIADGANYSAFYGPNLTVREAGRNISIPPAAHVSNLYIDKYNLALPYSIVAGPRRGVVTGQGLVGVEYAFDRNDLDSIEPFGYNTILNKKGFGFVINSNQTAQQTVKSALSQIHVRELLIYIQDGIEAILKNYRWEFNTPQNRLEIKTLADNFLTQILSDGGVFDFQNIMDTTNNTPEIIDNNLGILDTYIEPVRGLGVLVHRTTILRTGTITAGNFL